MDLFFENNEVGQFYKNKNRHKWAGPRADSDAFSVKHVWTR